MQKALLAASRRPGLRRVVTGTPATRRVVDRFVAGETLPRRARRRPGPGRRRHRRSPSTTSARTSPTAPRRRARRDAYLALLEGLAPLGLGPARRGVGEAVGLRPGAAGRRRTTSRSSWCARSSRRRPRSARRSPSTWRTTAPSTPPWPSLAELRREHPGTGAVLQAMLLPHRGRRPGPRRHRVPGAAGQGRLPRAGDRGVPGARTTSTPPTPAAWRCWCAAPGTRWPAPTTRR